MSIWQKFFGKKKNIGRQPSKIVRRNMEPKKFSSLGLEVEFPFEPYGIQRSMIAKVTRTLINKEHSLIESPTGTGKTLVLLCSSLAWQRQSKINNEPFMSVELRKKINQERREKILAKPCLCGRRTNKGEEGGDEDSCNKKLKTCHEEKKAILIESPYFKKSDEKQTVITRDENKPDIVTIGDEDSDEVIIIEDELEKEKKSMKHEQGPPSKLSEKSKINGSTSPPKVEQIEEDNELIEEEVLKGGKRKKKCSSCFALECEDRYVEEMDEEERSAPGYSGKVPQIYYGTRTHKQISQVVRELNKTCYSKNLKMCILSSRNQSCINNDIKDQVNRNDLCRDLISTKKKKANSTEGCPFYKDSNSNAMMFATIHTEKVDMAWDIEDANKFGKENFSCPYFGCRSLQESADITFCPYNYLLDPIIRKTLSINLSNSIVILDEAHNIEDICRDSASFVIDTKQIDDILESIHAASTQLLQGSDMMNAYQFFRDKFMLLKNYLIKYPFSPVKTSKFGGGNNDYIAKQVFSQNEMKECLSTIGLGPDKLSQLRENMKALRGDEEDDKKNDSKDSALSFSQMQFITQLSIALEFMYSYNNKHLNDYRAVVMKLLDRTNTPRNYRKTNAANDDSQSERILWQFSLLCMNPGVAFEKLHKLAWSVIVASGTLSPIESLKSELGCQFNNVFEGAHVIAAERIFASIVSAGPNNVDLNCSYQNSLTLNFQDEVGLIIRDICNTTPNGVLCFFPSYDRMENFRQRWFSRSIMKDIQRSGKKIFYEKKSQTPAEFEISLKSYYDEAKKKGAILFAVFRGKVSEGIDFADEAARAVVTIGIPYPALKEITVELKRDYNDVARAQRPYLMTGSDWYSSQAFRALNQALGRCIRHKDDWGAVIMIDSRLGYGQQNISKWLRRNLMISNNYAHLYAELKQFIDQRSLTQ